jgi:hypothetical protein
VNPIEHHALVAEVRHLLQAARQTAARQINTLLVHTNYEIGRRIVEHEQGGAWPRPAMGGGCWSLCPRR